MDPGQGEEGLVDPVAVYTAHGNVEAHSVAIWLEARGVPAHVVEDNSGLSQYAFGIVGHFHHPQVFVDKTQLELASHLIREFEVQRERRQEALASGPPIACVCEECGAACEFPASKTGTTQSCPRCGAFLDVGESPWPKDFDFGVETEDEPPTTLTAEQALDLARRLEQAGEWHAAVATYQAVAEQSPEHATYCQNSVAALRRRIDDAN